tara:strand:+ start:29 stop:313 length:285 start_codon:yes stop_codon:yes gene_type:complete
MERSLDYMENPYKGPQGEICHTIEALQAAQEDYARTFLAFIGPQGETCRTSGELEAARQRFKDQSLKLITPRVDHTPIPTRVDHTPIKSMDHLR